ncbi:MAG: Flp pilus assembly protein CpaB [Pseudomonadota bacterium]
MRLIILAVAAIAAVLAGYMVFNLSNQPTPEPMVQAPVEVIETPTSGVLVARLDLPVGTLITPDDLDWAPWPDDALNPNFIVEEDQPEAMEEATGWVVRTQIYENEPVIRQKVVAKGETGYMAALVKPGKRAIAVEISAETASSGFILPDDRVDVILSFEVEVDVDEGATEEQTITMTVIENARVLSIDQQLTVDPDTGQTAILGSTALLELEPGDTELLAHSESIGTISLALRSAQDALSSGDVVTSRRELLVNGFGAGGGQQVTVFRSGLPQQTSLGGS